MHPWVNQPQPEMFKHAQTITLKSLNHLTGEIRNIHVWRARKRSSSPVSSCEHRLEAGHHPGAFGHCLPGLRRRCNTGASTWYPFLAETVWNSIEFDQRISKIRIDPTYDKSPWKSWSQNLIRYESVQVVSVSSWTTSTVRALGSFRARPHWELPWDCSQSRRLRPKLRASRAFFYAWLCQRLVRTVIEYVWISCLLKFGWVGQS